MQYNEFRRHVGKAGLTVTSFAEMIGMNKTTIFNCSKAVAVPKNLGIIAMLMGEIVERGGDLHAIMGKINPAVSEITKK